MTTATPSNHHAPGLQVLSRHHAQLEERLEALMARAREGDPARLRAELTAFELELQRHLELEETRILPAFARHDAAEARALLAEHEAIRNAALEIGLDLDLHLVRAEKLDAFARQLKAHAHREDTGLYAWAETHLDAGVWHLIREGLRDIVKRARGGAPRDPA